MTVVVSASQGLHGVRDPLRRSGDERVPAGRLLAGRARGRRYLARRRSSREAGSSRARHTRT